MNDQSEDLLSQPKTIRRLWQFCIVVLALTVLAQLVFDIKGYFYIDGWFGFGAAYGFLCCLLMVLLAKLLGSLVKRPENYYQDNAEETASDD